ncbi:MAG TPA: hypothetical protein VGQ51_12725 [Puia sp.]|jgi:outer membrane biosynthesis protein TonB|nr:hypothetical protein [Puia sp.]
MSEQFESRKNMKATGYTTVVCAALLILLIGLSWTRPAEPQPVVEEGIEVNLGNSNQGLGKDQPYLPGDPSPQDKEKYTPPKQAVVEKEPVKDVETDDNQKEDAPVVKKAVVTKPDATKIPDKEVTRVKVKPVKVPETLPEKPKPIPHPKAVFRGVNGTGNGGNNADDYKRGGNEGIAGGHGDQGAPGGDPNSTNYTGGGHGNGAVAIRSGLAGRHIVRTPSFTGDFNENAKVAVTVHVDAGGNVTSAEYSLMGSTTSMANYKDLATEKARQIKFNPGSDESVGTLIFNFRIHN